MWSCIPGSCGAWMRANHIKCVCANLPLIKGDWHWVCCGEAIIGGEGGQEVEEGRFVPQCKSVKSAANGLRAWSDVAETKSKSKHYGRTIHSLGTAAGQVLERKHRPNLSEEGTQAMCVNRRSLPCNACTRYRPQTGQEARACPGNGRWQQHSKLAPWQ